MKTFPMWSGFAVVGLSLAVAFSSRDSALTVAATPSSAIKLFAFITEGSSGAVSSFRIDPATGVLSRVKGSPFRAGSDPEFLVSDGKYVYATNINSNNVSGFVIDPVTGALAPVPGSPFSAGVQPKGIALAANIKLLFVANVADNTISVFRINPSTGALSPLGSPTPAGPGPFDIAVNPAGTFLYVSNHKSNEVSGFAINASTGGLNPVPNSPFKTGQTPIGMTANLSGDFLYVIDHMQLAKPDRPQQSIASFRINPDSGVLTHVSGALSPKVMCSSACHLQPLRLAIHPGQHFAYASNVGADSVSPFVLHSNGTLSPISGPVAVGKHPFGLALDPRGHFLYAVNKVDSTISGFAVDASNGKLSALAGSPFRVDGKSPQGIVTVSEP
jgi:6-phosphogluconolactonase